MKKRLLLVGGGGHCKSVIDSILASGAYEELGVVDKQETVTYQDVSFVGTDDDLAALYNDGWNEAFITVGSVGDTRLRRKLFNLIDDIGFVIPVIADPSAVIAEDAVIGRGTFIGKRAVVNSDCSIGEASIINTGAIIEHECLIGDFAHISPGAVLCGQVKIGSNSHIGAGSVVRQQIIIGKNVLTGVGSVIVCDLPDNIKAYGNPCKGVEI